MKKSRLGRLPATMLMIITHFCCLTGCNYNVSKLNHGAAVPLKALGDSSFWTFKKYLGHGELSIQKEQDEDVLAITADDKEGMAATVNSRPFPVKSGCEYTVTMDIKTENLKPITARLVGGPYFYFNDKQGNPGGWYPAVALLVGPPAFIAPENCEWTTVSHSIKTPTTAGTARLFLAYAAYGTWDGGHPRVTGRAAGKLWIRNVHIKQGEPIDSQPVTIHVSDSTLQAGLNVASDCLHNSCLSGQFIVSDGYTISGNIVPDLSFGLYGVRRLAYPGYLKLLQEHWQRTAETIDAQGRVTSQRVMSQVLFPLGVDEIFSFTGDKEFLAQYLPLADRALAYVMQKADENGLSRLVEYGKWRLGEGADWVDWYPTRMEGKTLMFHQWYVRALRRMAALHEEFANTTIGHLSTAQAYRAMADRVEKSLRRLYWRNDHFIPNIDFGGKAAEEQWLDDQVWAIRLGIADASQTGKIWSWINSDPAKFEGVPMRWAGFEGPRHGPLSWFGRNGAGDILARYHSGDAQRGYELLQTVSKLFQRDQNVYEAYDMQGHLAGGTQGWGNYTEHSGGFIWSVIEGPFGIHFESDRDAAATVKPHYPASWSAADATIYVRGTRIRIVYSKEKHSLTLTGDGSLQSIRCTLPVGKTEIVQIGTDAGHEFSHAYYAKK